MSVSLAEIEVETARKVGPFYQLVMDRQVPTTANFQRAFFPALRSTVEQDLVTNLWLLRRGVDYQGNAVTVSPDDRQRMVANYDPGQGMVEVDRPWSAAPAVGEVCEFHHLDPEQQLRPAVRAGLRRTWFTDRYNLGSGFIYETDLTGALPWFADVKGVLEVQVGGARGTSQYWGTRNIPFEVFEQTGHVCLRLNTGMGMGYWGDVLITLARPHFSLVNGVDSLTGPTSDTDLLDVPLEWAAAAGHIEAWRNFPAKLQAAAAGNLQATQAMAATEFTRLSYRWAPRRPDRYELGGNFFWPTGSPVVVNA